MWPLRQSTASQEIPLGPFLDEDDGKTPETSLTIANTDIKLLKGGATSETNKNSGGATHVASGRYYAVLDATDTNTLGPMRASVHVAGALPVWLDCLVYPQAVYDALFIGSDYLQVDAVQVEGGDASDAVRDAVINDATRLDGSLLNSLSVPPTAVAIADAIGDEALADHRTSGTFGGALNRIGAAQIVISSPVDQNGNVTVIRGDDYNSDDGLALDWTDQNGTWPTLTDATILVSLYGSFSDPTAVLELTGSVVVATGSGKKVRAEPTAAQTSSLAANAAYKFEIVATLSSGRTRTLLRGTWKAED